MGYTNSNPIYNMQQSFISVIFLCGLIIIDSIRRLFKLLPCKVPSFSWGKLESVKIFISNRINSIFVNLYWNIIFRTFIEIYIDLLLACLIRCTTRETDSKYEKFITYSCYVGFCLLIFLFFLVTYIAWSNRNSMSEESFKKRFEELVAGLSVTKSGSFMYNPFFLFERIVLALNIILLQNYSFF